MTGRSLAPDPLARRGHLGSRSPLLPGFTVEVLPSIDSTNTELMRRARAGLAEPTLLVAEPADRRPRAAGPALAWRGGRCAHVLAGHAAGAGRLVGPVARRGVSVAESLQPTPLAGAARIGLKWPNDLWLDGDRKLAGILVETASIVAPGWEERAAPATRYVVAGIGINVQPPQADGMNTPPGSLQDVEPGLDAPTALQRIAAPLVAMLQSFEAYGFAPVQARFHQRDVLSGRAVTLSDGTTGTAHGVGEDGALLVHTAQGMQAVTRLRDQRAARRWPLGAELTEKATPCCAPPFWFCCWPMPATTRGRRGCCARGVGAARTIGAATPGAADPAREPARRPRQWREQQRQQRSARQRKRWRCARRPGHPAGAGIGIGPRRQHKRSRAGRGRGGRRARALPAGRHIRKRAARCAARGHGQPAGRRLDAGADLAHRALDGLYGPLHGRRHAGEKRAELRARKVPYDRPGAALEPGLSLGRFSTEEAAERALATLGTQGVRTARVVQERTDATGYVLRLPAATAALRTQVEGQLRGLLASRAFRACG